MLVSTDGFVSEDGHAGWAFIATRGDEHVEQAGALSEATSHLAEWTAAARALAWAEETLIDGDALELRTDSALVEKGLASRRPEMSGEAATLRAACRQALARLVAAGITARVVRVRREENVEADAAARRAAQM